MDEFSLFIKSIKQIKCALFYIAILFEGRHLSYFIVGTPLLSINHYINKILQICYNNVMSYLKDSGIFKAVEEGANVANQNRLLRSLTSLLGWLIQISSKGFIIVRNSES